jgi:hypothetical protein
METNEKKCKAKKREFDKKKKEEKKRLKNHSLYFILPFSSTSFMHSHSPS